jgi:GDP-4-dehydro-6-deoxy-D-mannose reductase
MAIYLITGANGFCGRHLSNLLRDKENIVYGISRKISEVLPSKYPHVKYEQVNLVDHAAVYNLLKKIKPDYIFHLAAESSVASSWNSPINILNNNALGQLNIFEVLRELNIDSRVVVACSSEEYGLVDESKLPVNENCCFNPLSTYAVSKVAQDMLAYQYYKSYDMDIIRVRSFNLTGPGRSPTYALSSFAKQITDIERNPSNNILSVGNLNVQRDYTDVRDAMKAYHAVAQNGKTGEVYNLCSGKAYLLSELLDKMISYSNTKINIEVDQAKLRPSDIPVMVGDNSKIRREVNWEPLISIEKTLNDLLDYWRSYDTIG